MAAKRKTIVISGFPGIGKSTLAQNARLNTLDLDSGDFSWCPGKAKGCQGYNCPPNKNGVKVNRCRNPHANRNYGEAILDMYKSGAYDYIFVSTHESTRKFLHDNGIKFFLVYPALGRKDEFEHNYTERRSHPGMIKFVIGNWDKLIEGLNNDQYAYKKIVMEEPNFLAHYIARIKRNANQSGGKRSKSRKIK